MGQNQFTFAEWQSQDSRAKPTQVDSKSVGILDSLRKTDVLSFKFEHNKSSNFGFQR
jgi:hypothetical protein